MSLADHVAEVLRAVSARLREDVCMLGVWITAEGAAVIGWNTSRRLRANGTAWEWNQWRFQCPDALVVEAAPPLLQSRGRPVRDAPGRAHRRRARAPRRLHRRRRSDTL